VSITTFFTTDYAEKECIKKSEGSELIGE